MRRKAVVASALAVTLAASFIFFAVIHGGSRQQARRNWLVLGVSLSWAARNHTGIFVNFHIRNVSGKPATPYCGFYLDGVFQGITPSPGSDFLPKVGPGLTGHGDFYASVPANYSRVSLSELTQRVSSTMTCVS